MLQIWNSLTSRKFSCGNNITTLKWSIKCLKLLFIITWQSAFWVFLFLFLEQILLSLGKSGNTSFDNHLECSVDSMTFKVKLYNYLNLQATSVLINPALDSSWKKIFLPLLLISSQLWRSFCFLLMLKHRFSSLIWSYLQRSNSPLLLHHHLKNICNETLKSLNRVIWQQSVIMHAYKALKSDVFHKSVKHLRNNLRKISETLVTIKILVSGLYWRHISLL